MRSHRNGLLFSVSILILFAGSSGIAGAQDPAIGRDPPPDKVNPAAMETIQLPSHGVQLNAFVYVAAGIGPHPTVVLLHGFPGNERNLDLAQAIRRSGWNVMYFDYRGSWGSPGNFTFTHCIEDTESALAYLRDPATAAYLRSDPNTIAVIGHSMGGFVALQVGARDKTVSAVFTISATDLGTSRLQEVTPENHDRAAAGLAAGLIAQGMAPFAGTTAISLANEVLANAVNWNILSLAPKLASRPLLVITSDDGFSATNDAFVEVVRKAGNHAVKSIQLATDHSYSDRRIALQAAVIGELARLRQE